MYFFITIIKCISLNGKCNHFSKNNLTLEKSRTLDPVKIPESQLRLYAMVRHVYAFWMVK